MGSTMLTREINPIHFLTIVVAGGEEMKTSFRVLHSRKFVYILMSVLLLALGTQRSAHAQLTAQITGTITDPGARSYRVPRSQSLTQAPTSRGRQLQTRMESTRCHCYSPGPTGSR